MKRKLLLLLLFCISILSIIGQSRTDSLFEKGGYLFEEKDYIGAIRCFKEVEKEGKNFKYYNQCIYNLAYTYDKADSSEQAILWYENIRKSNLKDNERVGGRGIFEPYSNYKHYSTFNIANIEYNRNNFKKALMYYQQCLSKYPYYNKSGTDKRINKNRLKVYITDCLTALKKYEDALLTIVPEALDSYQSSNYNLVVSTALTLIENNFQKKELVVELEKAFLTIKLAKNSSFNFIWRNKKLVLMPYAFDTKKGREKFIEEIKQTDFWMSLTE